VNRVIFISYARKDGAELALRLQKDLRAAGFDAWLDRQRIEGGASWTLEIEEAIDRAQMVLALLTPGSYVSEICRAEQLRSLRKGKCLIPVLAGYGGEVVPLYLEGKNWRRYPEQWSELLGDIEAHNGAALAPGYRTTPATYITAPPTVANYIERREAVRALRETLFGADEHRAVALTALEGMGGIGKTVLAQALFQDEVVRQAFPDGLVWITVGREPTHDFTARLREIAKVLGGGRDETVAAETLYRTTIAGKAALIVLDDIWSKADLDPFLAESPRSRFLFTTRDAAIARFSGAREHRVDLLDEPQARELLALWAGALAPGADDILPECGGLPLALSTVGAMLRDASPAEWADTAKLLHNADLSTIEDQLPPGQQSFFRAIDVSVKALPPEMRQRYGKLAVLLEDMPAALPVLQTLWNVDESEARRIGRRLVDRSLAQRDAESAIRLHDLQLDYVRAQYPDKVALALIHGATRLSTHVIGKDPRQFASQVLGRLLPYRGAPAIQQFLDEIAAGAPRPWLRPVHPALHPPGTALLCMLVGHSGGGVNGVAVTPDGKRAVSASSDKTLKVWDVDTGRALRTLEGHSGVVHGVALTPDGMRAVSASYDNTLKVWDLETGCAPRTLEGHTEFVNAVAVTPDGKWAVSASDDNTLKLWDLETCGALQTLRGHANRVCCVVVTPDGKRAVSASSDYTLKVWELDTGRALQTLEGHSDVVCGVAVTADGKRAVSASWDNTLRVWDLDTGREPPMLEGHGADVHGVAVTPDGKRVISASEDHTLKTWDPDTGRALRTLKGHFSAVSCVAVTADGKRAVSAAADRTLKVWDLETGRTLRRLEVQSVWRVAVTADGKRAVSTSLDKTLKVWDLETGRALHTLEGHSDWVYGVAVTSDGKWAVSASADRTLKVWDLDTGRALRTLESHSNSVNGVAVTADGKRAVSMSGDHTLKVWDLDTGRALRTLEGHSDSFTGVAVTPDGKRAVSASADNTLRVWDLEAGMPIAAFDCDGSGRCCAFVDEHRIVAGDAGGRVYFLSLEESGGRC